MDYLSDHGYPAQHATIIGTDLRLVESVLGRMTVARARPGRRRHRMAAVAAERHRGALWGAAFAAVAHAATRGRRDFASHRHLSAADYDLTVAAHEQHARRLLLQHAWRTH